MGFPNRSLTLACCFQPTRLHPPALAQGVGQSAQSTPITARLAASPPTDFKVVGGGQGEVMVDLGRRGVSDWRKG